MKQEWRGFKGSHWADDINVRDFIQNNYTQYDGDQSFLEGPTDATNKLWGKVQELQKQERAKNGVLDMETEVVSGINAYGPVGQGTLEYFEVHLSQATAVYYGPGFDYAQRQGTVPAGTLLRLYDFENGFAMCDYQSAGKWVRAYFPAL